MFQVSATEEFTARPTERASWFRYENCGKLTDMRTSRLYGGRHRHGGHLRLKVEGALWPPSLWRLQYTYLFVGHSVAIHVKKSSARCRPGSKLWPANVDKSCLVDTMRGTTAVIFLTCKCLISCWWWIEWNCVWWVQESATAAGAVSQNSPLVRFICSKGLYCKYSTGQKRSSRIRQ